MRSRSGLNHLLLIGLSLLDPYHLVDERLMTLLFLAGVLFQICNPKSTLPTDQIGEDAAPSV